MAKKSPTSDQKTLDLIREVKNRKEEISKAERPNWLTNCSFSFVDGNLNGAVNIHVESNIKNLISYVAFLLDKERSYKEAATVLAIDSPPTFAWNGFSVGDWIKDIKTRISKIQIASKKKKLEELESRLSAIISPELRAQMELDAIASELS